MSDQWYSQTPRQDIQQKAKWPSNQSTLPDRAKSSSLGVSQTELSPTTLWKKRLLLFPRVTAISLIFRNILYNLTLKRLATTPRTQAWVSPGCQSCMAGGRVRSLPASPSTTCPALGHSLANSWEKWSQCPHTLSCLQVFAQHRPVHTCARCWLCSWLLPLAFCHTGRKGTEISSQKSP